MLADAEGRVMGRGRIRDLDQTRGVSRNLGGYSATTAPMNWTTEPDSRRL